MVPCTSTSDGVHETGLGLRELHEMYYNGAGMMSSLAALLFESREARVLADEKGWDASVVVAESWHRSDHDCRSQIGELQ